MQNARTVRKLLSLFLVLTILGTLLVPAAYADPGAVQNEGEDSQSIFSAPAEEADGSAEQEPYAADEIVRVSIFLEDPAPIDAGYSMDHVSRNASLVAYRDQLKSKQNDVQARIENAIGAKLDVKMNLTLLANAISVELPYGELDLVRQVPGVKSVELERCFQNDEPVKEEPAQPNTANTATYMVGASEVWAEGYTGAGARIAIIDTGIDTTHQSFDADAFEHAIQETGKDVDLFTQADLNAIKSQLNASSAVYVSSKIPFGYNYVDYNTTINHLSDTQGEHGSHVAGIAAANRFIKSGSDYVDAADAVGALGMAPDAQIFVMKVFSSGYGPFESTYVGAIEDALVLDCDVVNMSLGSASQGFSYSDASSYQNTWNKIADMNANTKMVVSISAGNSFSFTEFLQGANGGNYDLYIEDVHMHTGGDPGSYLNSLCVASADNTHVRGTPMIFNDSQKVFYTETGNSGGKMTDVAGSYDYVYIDAVGNASDYSTVNAQLSLAGKIVLVNRGEISFVDKGNNAISYNPKGLVVANNTSGTVNMSLTDYTGSFPMVAITLADALTIKENSEAHTAGSITYYTGTVQVTDHAESTQISANAEMSNFSSWGAPGALTMKPEITAPGGSIYSVWGANKAQSGAIEGGSDQYELMSGTSMAAPHISGLTGTLGQYLRENNISIPGKTTRQIVQSLLMSTAVPMHIGSEDGPYYSILQQGAGLANVRQAVHASSFIFMNEDANVSYADGKVKAEIGDKPARFGSYTWSFNLYNTASQAQTYALSTDLFTQGRYVGEDGYAHMAQSTTLLDWPVSYSTGSTVTVPAGGSQTVTVTITIPADMSEFDALYPRGAYVEGFTYVESQTTTTDGAKLDVRHSIPILGFYGSWTDPNMFDHSSYVDVNVNGDPRTGYAGDGSTNYITYSRGSSSTTKYVTGNPYFTETPFPADRLAMRTTDTVKQIRYLLVRPAGTTGIGVSRINEQGQVTGVLDSTVDNTNVQGMYYSQSSGAWQNNYSKTKSVNKTFASYGAQEGDRIRFGYYAIPEYNAMQVNEDLNAVTAGVLTSSGFARVLQNNVLGKGALVGYDFYMDNTAPVILSAIRNGTQVVVTVKDENWIAKLALLNGSTTVQQLIPEQSVRGQTVTYSFDISGISNPANLKVFAGDYAENEATAQPEELSYTITASVNNPAWGSVAVYGSSILAEPIEGYYVESAQVLSGTAELVINGNTISVNPSSDCSIQVNFAPRPQITVHFVANGEDEGSVTGYLNDSIQLPGTIQNTNFTEDYSFIGWYGATLLETEQTPDYYLPREQYTLTENTTLYAMFRRFEGNNGELFRLVTETPDEIEGRYVISSGKTTDSYILPTIPKGEQYKNHKYETKISTAGATITDGSVMTDVPLTNIFIFEHSDTAAAYTIKSASTDGVYVNDASSGLNAVDTVSSNAKWTVTKDTDSYEGKFLVSSLIYSTYALCYTSSNYWDTSSNTNYWGVFLWKGEPTGTPYYTTNPVAANHTHELEHHEAVPPTCGADGNTEYWRCTICGKYFSDAQGQNQISLADTVVPATGEHNYEGASCTSNNDGTHNHVCNVCGQTATENCSYEDVVTPPTQTSQGYTTHTCVHCGYSFIDSYVPALGSTFTVTFSVFGNTTVIAPMESNTGTGITLPTAQAPEGYKFLGWVTGTYNNVTVRPTGILNGNYVAPENITLYALFSRVEGGTGEVVYTLQTEAPADWGGRWIITRGKTNTCTVLTGIAGGSYESGNSGGATAFISSGMTMEDDAISGASELYVFDVQSKNGNYAIRNAAKDNYLAQQSYALQAVSSYDAATCDWSFTMQQNGEVNIKNVNASSYPYIGCGSYFMCTASTGIGLSLWAETPSGTVYYTTEGEGGEPTLPCDGGEGCPGKIFTDMPAKGHWAHDAIDWAIVKHVTAGTTETTFSPAQICTRAQTLTFLWRAAGSPEPDSMENPFTDVEPGSYYEKAVLWAVGMGITAGTGENRFSPYATCTRSQVVTFLWRLAGSPEPETSVSPFRDLDLDAYFAPAVLWAWENGITAGTTTDRFSPDTVCNRAQVVTFLYRMMN